jgi:hypothetical protein
MNCLKEKENGKQTAIKEGMDETGTNRADAEQARGGGAGGVQGVRCGAREWPRGRSEWLLARLVV